MIDSIEVHFRLLQYGGAAMVEIKLPIKRPRLIARDVSHVFVDSDQKKAVEELLNNGVLCLLPVYIGSFLIMVGVVGVLVDTTVAV